MQTCDHCRQILIIGLTGALHENGTNTPDIECLNCGQINEAVHSAYEALDTPSGDCVMCGVDYGTTMRKDGLYYCHRCWQVWNS